MDAAIKEAGGVPWGKSRGRMFQAEKGIYKGLGTGFRGVDTWQGDRAEVKQAGSRPVAQRGLQCRVLSPGKGRAWGRGCRLRTQCHVSSAHISVDVGKADGGTRRGRNRREAIRGPQQLVGLAVVWLRQRWRRTEGTVSRHLPGVHQLRGIRNNTELF